MSKNQSNKPQPIPVDVKAVQEKHPDAIILKMEQDDENYTFAFDRPKRQHINLAMGGAAKKMGQHLSQMVIALLIAPTKEEAATIFDYYPGMPLALGGQLLEAAGVKDAEVVRP